jgi:hypothetical protein
VRLAAGGFVAFGLVAALVRIGNYAAPLVGDAAQYLYVGHVVAHGGTPYLDAAYNKGPLTALLFAGVGQLAGHSVVLVHLCVVPFAAATALALAGYIAHHAGRGAGAFAGLTFAVFSALQRLDGAEGRTEQYGVAPVFGALWLATRRGGRAAAGAGALLGCAVLINPALGLAAPAVALQLWLTAREGREAREAQAAELSRRRAAGALAAAAGGALVPVALACIWLAAAGGLHDMLVQVGGQVTDSVGPAGVTIGGAAPLALGRLPLDADLPPVLLWALGVVGCALALSRPRLRGAVAVLGLVMVATLVRVKAPIYAFDYQYYPAVPAICGAIALGLAALPVLRPLQRAAIALVVLAPALWTLAVHPQLDLLGRDPVDREPRAREIRGLAAFVRGHTRPTDRIFVVGGHDEVYWVARRRAPTRFFDAFGVNGAPRYRVERRHDLLRHPPAAIVTVLPEHAETDRSVIPLIRTRRYFVAYVLAGDEVWLRRG